VLIPGVPLIELSIGNVTRDSISSGASPGASVSISTWGGAKLGKTSNGICGMVLNNMITVKISAAITTNQRREITHLATVLIIIYC
jgi:hypothetical protein